MADLFFFFDCLNITLLLTITLFTEKKKIVKKLLINIYKQCKYNKQTVLFLII